VPLQFEWTNASGAPAVFELDCAETVSYEDGAEVTEHAVETGPAVVDQIRPRNGTVTVAAVITNTPARQPASAMDGATAAATAVDLGAGRGGATVLRFSRDVDRLGIADQTFRDLIAAQTLVTLRTSLRVVDSLALARYQVQRDAATGAAFSATFELKRVRIATTEVVPVAAARRRRDQRAQDRGAQPTTPAGPRLQSIANRALTGLGVL
jgi:hypothetical protein